MAWWMPGVGSAPAEEQRRPRLIEGVEEIVPRGDYARVRLELEVPDAPDLFQRWRYTASLCDGRMRIDHGVDLREPGGSLEMKNGRLSGAFARAEGRRRNHQLSSPDLLPGIGRPDVRAPVRRHLLLGPAQAVAVIPSQPKATP
jgi:hypothetical protein